MQLLSADNYYTALVQATIKAKKRIVLAAMVLVWGEHTAPLFDALKDAAKRGVDVRILLDNYTRMSGRYNLQPRPSRSARIRRTFEALEELSKLGATVYCFGKVGIVPYKGRCHVKLSVVDNSYFSFGGVNILDQNFKLDDYMLYGKDSSTADHLAALVATIGTTIPPLPDSQTPINARSTILFDGGRPHHSLIYERACELTAQAKRVYLVSQYAPSGQLAELLNETNATCYFNRPEQLIVPDAWGQAFDQQRYRIANTHTSNKYIHAKFLLAEMPSGQYVTLCGSHNFSYRSVAFGTQEIALYSTSKNIWSQFYTFMQSFAE